jgi:UDP-glucose 4-epimerase
VGSGRLPRNIAITGLGTFVGGRVAERLLDADDPPRVVALDVDLPRRLEGRLPLHRVDLTEPTADSLVAEILAKERCEAVLHAAFFTEPHPDHDYSHELEMIGSLHVMNATAAVGVPKLVVSSSAQVYGAHPDNPNFLDETRPLRPPALAHQIRDRAEVESLLELFAERHPRQCVTSLRPCWVLGPTIESAASRFFEASRVFTPLGYDPLVQILHEEDLLRAVELALENDAPGPINLAGEGVLPLSTLLSLAGKSRWPLPAAVLYRLTSLDWLRRTGDPPEAFYEYLRYLWTVDTRRAKEQLGFEPEHTTKEAWMSFVVSRRLRRYR